MAPRPTTGAAGGLLACAVLLLLGGQSAAVYYNYGFPFTATFPTLFPVGYAPPIVRIYSIQNDGHYYGFNMAIRNGQVVLVAANDRDPTQLWWKIPAPTSLVDGEGEKYFLVNVYTKQAMTSPTRNADPVQLAEFNPFNSQGKQLWVPSPPRPLDAGFYQIKPYTQDFMALNGLGGYLYDGTVIGIYYDKPVSPNTLWFTKDIFPFPYY